VHDVPYSEDAVSSIPHVPYEFPNGFNDEYGHERFKIPEALFDPNSKPDLIELHYLKRKVHYRYATNRYGI
jgi:hypothetical protein